MGTDANGLLSRSRALLRALGRLAMVLCTQRAHMVNPCPSSACNGNDTVESSYISRGREPPSSPQGTLVHDGPLAHRISLAWVNGENTGETFYAPPPPEPLHQPPRTSNCRKSRGDRVVRMEPLCDRA